MRLDEIERERIADFIGRASTRAESPEIGATLRLMMEAIRRGDHLRDPYSLTDAEIQGRSDAWRMHVANGGD